MVTGPGRPGTDGPPGVTNGYSVVLPPGWVRLPLRRDTDRAIDAVVATAARRAPRDGAAALRREMRRRLRLLAARAREGSGLDLYLPTEQVGGTVLTCSFVVSEMRDPGAGGAEVVEPAALLVRLLAREGSRPVELPSALAVRSERRVDGEGDGDETSYGSRRVEYVLPVPRDPGRWVVAAFSTVGAGDPTDAFADLQVELFDAVMTTFRWSEG